MIILNGELFQNLNYRIKDNDGSYFVFVEGIITGVDERDRFDRAIKGDLVVVDIPKEYIFIHAICNHGFIDYNDTLQDENTEYQINYVLEKTKYQSRNINDLFASLMFENIRNKVISMAYKEILIESNITTNDEFEEKITRLYRDNYKELSYQFIKDVNK